MKKIIVLIFLLVVISVISMSQSYTATVAVGDVNLSKLKSGDDVIVPVRLIEKSGGLVLGFQFFIEFDHSILRWKGTMDEPLEGVRNINKKMQYSSVDWLFNDNGNQMAAIWIDPALKGVDLENGEVFFEFVFIYNGGLNMDQQYSFNWGGTHEEVENRVVRGITEMYSEKDDLYALTKISGIIK